MHSSKGEPITLATTKPVPGSGTTVSIDASVGINKVTALKYSIAALLLCASSVVAGIYTCLTISAILSAAAVPVLFAAISVVAALVALSSTVYLIQSFVSAVNSEKKIDLSEKKPDSELGGNEKCKVPEEQQQKNNDNAAKMQPVTKVPTAPDTLPVSPLPNGAPAASPPPPPPPLPHSAAPPPPPPPPSLDFPNSSTQPCNAGLLAEMKNTKLKKTNGPEQNKPLPAGADGKLASFAKELETKVSNAGAKNEEYIAKIEREQKERREQNASPREALLTAIREGVKLKPVEQKPKEGKTQQPPNTASQDIAQILARRKHIETPDSESESERSDHSDSEDWTDNEGDKQKSSASFNRDSDRSVDGKEPRKKKLKKRSERSIPQTHQPDNKKRSESPDSGCASDDDVYPKPTSPSHSSAPKAGKPQVPPKSANLQARSEASPVKKECGVSPMGSEIKDLSALSVKERIKMFGN